MSLYLYKLGFVSVTPGQPNMGRAVAVAWLLFLIIVLIAVLNYLLTQRLASGGQARRSKQAIRRIEEHNEAERQRAIRSGYNVCTAGTATSNAFDMDRKRGASDEQAKQSNQRCQRQCQQRHNTGNNGNDGMDDGVPALEQAYGKGVARAAARVGLQPGLTSKGRQPGWPSYLILVGL